MWARSVFVSPLYPCEHGKTLRKEKFSGEQHGRGMP
nr:MAG TPA: hypothetical protein [Caudoviricetes sp.]